ncbi:MAG: RHS repeat-associated core domain-containing protein [Prolixibacteraceae bacterium]
MNYEFFPDNPARIRKIGRKNMEETVSSVFDVVGKMIEIQDKFGKVTCEYDQVNRPVHIRRSNAPGISYSYNTSDQLTGLSTDNGYRIEYVYDFLGRIAAMKTPAGEITYRYYTGDGIIERVLPNGIRTQYKYLPDGKLDFIAHAEKSGNILTKYTYRYNPDGLLSEIEEWTSKGVKKVAYRYDHVQRLSLFIDAEGIKTTYNYDDFGNRTETTVNGNTAERYTYDGLGRLTSYNDISAEHDNSGNLLTDENGATVYKYNDNNQLTATGNSTFEYAGDGSLFCRITNNQKTTYFTNPLGDIWQPIVADNDEKDSTFYIWEGNTPIASVEKGKTNFFLTDHLGSVRGIADANGMIIQKLDYSPFGIPQQDIASNSLMPGFSGLFYDPEAKLYVTRARAYNPNTGRFMQIDPLHQTPSGTQKDLSLFTYCGGDPVNNLDNKGLSTQSNELDFKSIQMRREAEIKKIEILQGAKVSDELLKQLHMDFNPVEKWVETVLLSSYLAYADASILFSNSLNAFTAFSSVVYTTGKAMQIMNPPPYIRNKTSTGWDGTYNATTNNSRISASEKLITGSKNDWREKGEIIQNRQTVLSDQSGKQSINEEYNTPATNCFERFLMHTFPLGSYFDPETTTIKTYKSTSIKYYELTRNGETEIITETPKNNAELFGSPVTSSNIGGIYLGGAGKAFEGLGELTGIAVDENNGKLVLLAEDKGTIDLPPLRMDDVVTVFRSVYQHGEAPFVSIDPDSVNPKGPIMHTRHGAATDSTYVGWILFEADRVMKAYSLGEDNMTKQPVKTKVAGYDSVLETMFSEDTQGPNWERFWIVPSSVSRNNSSDQSLTLLDVPLMVKTQKMALQKGKLVTAPNGKSSKGAEAFSKWFTDHYDQIADESFSMPPAESGMTKPVPVFKELQRIALITAIAEQLRDRGVTLPFWMRTYEVKPFPTPEITSSHTVTRQKGAVIHTVFGGVNLSPATDKIFTRSASPDANTITPKIAETFRKQSLFVPVKMTIDNKKFEAAVLPGNDTKDLVPCILNETDLSVRVTNDFYLVLTRKYNSFITPLDHLFGETWSLDLPFLEEQKIPEKISGDAVSYRVAWNLISPMNNYTERPENIYRGDHKLIGFKTKLVCLPNGKNLHFNEKGFLVAFEKKPKMILYNRDKRNRVIRIVGFLGQKAVADIRLQYDKNRVIAANGSDGGSVKYEYSGDDELKQVTHSKKAGFGLITATNDVVDYDYQDGFVTGIKYNGKAERQFHYNDKGQLTGESSPGYADFEYKVIPGQFDSKVITYVKQEAEKEKKSFLSKFELKKKEERSSVEMEGKDMVQYDQSFRPILKTSDDGTVIRWDYSDKVADRMEVSVLGVEKYRMQQSKDRRNCSCFFPDSINYNENYNEAGQLVSLTRNGQVILQQKWNSIGELDERACENSVVSYEYDNDGALKRTLITPPGEGNSYKEWVEYAYDETGNKTGLSDCRGLKINYQYDENGFLSSIHSNQGSIEINRDHNRINSVKTSWGGKVNYLYDKEGNIREINNSALGNGSYLRFTGGKISEVAGNNGSKYIIKYGPDSKNNQIKEIKTPVNKLEYGYTDEGYLENVRCNGVYEVAYSYDGSGRIRQIRINAR